MARTRVEFTVEPFEEGRPGPHVQATFDAVSGEGLDLDVGPFGSAFEADATVAARALSRVVDAAFANGATRVSCQVSLTDAPEHPFAAALRPLVEAMGVELLSPDQAREGDVPLRWDGVVVAAARLPQRKASVHGALSELITEVEREIGGPLVDLSRAQKQVAARLLYERGAFALRNAADDVADAMGVSRVTIYNYLNAVRERELNVLRVLTWNLWWRHGDFEARHAAIEAVLRAENADVVCLQEVWANIDGTHQGAMLADALGYELATTEGPWFSGWSVNNVVLSRFPIARRATVVLPAADGTPSHRRATTAVLATPWGEWPVISTHTEHRFDRSTTRQAQCAALAQAVASLRGDPSVDLPVVLGGDLNAVPDSDEIRMLTGRTAPPVDGLVLTDAWEARGDGSGHTWNSANPYLADAAWPNRRLDYVLVSWPRPKPMGHPARVWLAGTEPVDGVMPSDHYAIVADLRTDRAEPAP